MSELARDLRDGLRGQPLRALLAVFAVAIGAGTASLLTIVLISLETVSRGLVSELGADTLVAVAADSGEGAEAAGPLRREHVSVLRANAAGARMSTVTRSTATTLGSHEPLRVIGTDGALASIRGWRVSDGRFLDRLDVTSRDRHAVLSRSVAEEWGWRTGHVVMLGTTPFVVVGVVEVAGDALSGELGDPSLMLGERLVFVPHSVEVSWDRDRRGSRMVDAIYFETAGGEEPSLARERLENLLAAPDVRPSSISWITPETLVEGIRRLQLVLGGTVALVSWLCLLLGGTTLMSLMVSNVRERVPEIGLRRAIGATRLQVAGQFLCEALLLTLGGALCGVLGGRFAVPFLESVLPMPVVAGWVSWILPVFVCVVLGLGFTLWPAMEAARVEPARALRAQ